MTPTATIKYEPFDEPLGIPGSRVVFGGYHVTYADGIRIWIPHTGYIGTISAEPLNPENPEERQLLLNGAQDVRDDMTASEGA